MGTLVVTVDSQRSRCRVDLHKKFWGGPEHTGIFLKESSLCVADRTWWIRHLHFTTEAVDDIGENDVLLRSRMCVGHPLKSRNSLIEKDQRVNGQWESPLDLLR